ncbi:MAG: hypothetical protein AB8C13_03435 [Phycisphaerales bacterium]
MMNPHDSELESDSSPSVEIENLDPDTTEIESRLSRPKSKTRSILITVVSILLLAGAGYFVFSGSGGMMDEWESVRSSPWWMIVLVILGPLGNHLSVAMCLRALLNRFGNIGKREMIVLVGSAWLFNYLPMRPGLIGRMGYHKSVNKIRLRDSFQCSVWSGVLAGVSNGIMLIVAILMTLIGSRWSILMPALPVVGMFVIAGVMQDQSRRLMFQALAFRLIDVIVWLGRYWLAFRVLGLEMDIADIAIISAVSQLASLMPLTGSGLGFREWGVGLTASAGGYAMKTAIAGDLINRAAETLIVFPVGLVCTGIIARHFKRIESGQINTASGSMGLFAQPVSKSEQVDDSTDSAEAVSAKATSAKDDA